MRLNSLVAVLAIGGTVAVMLWRVENRPSERPEVFRGAAIVVRPMTAQERADELVRAIDLMRRAGWEPSLEDVTWPEDWKPPDDWQPPQGWLPPTWWPES